MVFHKVKNLVLSLIKTENMDSLLRALKKFYLDNAKRFYNLLKDYMLA